MNQLEVSLADDLDGAFPLLMERTGSGLYWGLRRLTSSHQDAEDLTQETFIRAYRALSDYDSERIATIALEPWLWTIALNLGRNHLRDRARRPTPAPAVEEPRWEDPELPDTKAWDRRLSALNRHQRTAVVLRHVVGLGIAEIAAATSRPEGTVKADVHRGLAKLKKMIEEEK